MIDEEYIWRVHRLSNSSRKPRQTLVVRRCITVYDNDIMHPTRKGVVRWLQESLLI